MSKLCVVVGGGMVAHRFVEALRSRDEAGEWRVTVLAEEPRPPYDRVALTSYFENRDPELLNLGEAHLWQDPNVKLRRGAKVVSVDPAAHTVMTENGMSHAYDSLVLATGSYAFMPPVPGRELPGCFVYRTIDDVAALRGYVETLQERNPKRRVRGAVIGGGLLGLEAAGALKKLGADTTVVEFAPRLMPLQVDEGGGESLKRLIEAMDVDVRVGTATSAIKGRIAVEKMVFNDGSSIDVDVVIFATGVRPRDELAREAGLEVGERGGIVVDDSCRTADPDIYAIGEVACIQGRVWGLVGPGYTMAEVAVDQMLGRSGTFTGGDLSTKLKLLGVDVASFGDAFGATDGALSVVYTDPIAGVYKKLVLSDDARTLLGGILVGDALGLRRPPAPAGPAARRRPRRVPGARRRGGRPRPGRAARRRPRLLLQQRDRRRHPLLGHRGRLHRPRRCQGVHQGRHQLRLLPAAGPQADGGRAREVRDGRQQRPVRALRALAGPAVRRRPDHRPHHLLRDHRPARPRPRLRHLQARRRLDPGQPRQRAHPGR